MSLHPVAVLRRLLRAPAFSLLVFALAAGAVFAGVSAFAGWYTLRHKALPYPEAARLVLPIADMRGFGVRVGLTVDLRERLLAQPAVFDAAAGWTTERPQRERGGAREWSLLRATPDLLPLLGVAPALGRAPAAGEADAMLLSWDAWRTRFGGATSALGARIALGDTTWTVVGVLPEGFHFPDRSADAWVGYRPSAAEVAASQQGSVGELDVLARLAPGVSLAQGREALAAVFAAAPELAGLRGNADLAADLVPLRAQWAEGGGGALEGFAAATVLLLAVVAFNLGSLMLERIARRERELAVRRAIGASRRHLLLAACGDVLLPGLAGAALGIAAVPWGGLALRHFGLLPAQWPLDIELDPVVVAVGLACALALLLAAAAVGALGLLRRLDRAGLQTAPPAGGFGRARSGLLVAQLALTTVLVGVSLLLLRSTGNLLAEDTGFDREKVLMLNLDLADADGALPADADARMRTLLEALRALPGVAVVAQANLAPFTRSESVTSSSFDGGPPRTARQRLVGPGYFAAMGIALPRGREFSDADLATPDAGVVVDEQFVARHLQGVEPVGAQLPMPPGADGQPRTATVLGVARTIRHRTLDEALDLPTIYQLVAQPAQLAWISLRIDGDPAAQVAAARATVQRLLPDARIWAALPLGELVSRSVAAQRTLGGAFAAFGGATLLLAALGLHAALAFAFQRRRRELAVRLALGATPGRVRRLVLAQGLRLAAAALPVGVLAGVLLAHVRGAQLHRITAGDPATWVATGGLVLAVVLLACLRPARQASQVSVQSAMHVD